VQLDYAATSYLLGSRRATKERLCAFTGAALDIGKTSVVLAGTHEQIELAKLCVEVTLQQRRDARQTVPYDELERRDDVETLDVPVDLVGFVLGAKGASLRSLESTHHVFLFFDNLRVRRGANGACKRLFVIGSRRDRTRAIDEARRVCRRERAHKPGTSPCAPS
jgi:hypothetical protein